MNQNIVAIIGGVLLLGVIASAVALAFHGTVSGDAVLALLGGIVAVGTGALAVHTGVNAGANAALATPTPPATPPTP